MSVQFTPDQQEIVDFLLEQIDNPDGCNVVVSGSGGTGKTTMICELISRLIADGYRVAVTAMTGKATAVLRNKIRENILSKGMKIPPSTQLKIETVTKLTKESRVAGLTASGETVYTNTWNDPKIFARDYDVLFVDELSMVPHFVSQWWQMSGIRVFGFGDECQLPEVTTNEIKKELSGFRHDLKVPETKYVSGYGIKVLKDLAQKQLHKVLRSDNEVALLCGELRDFKQSRSEFIGRIKIWAEKSENIQYSTSIKDLKTTSDWQIICYTNKMCQKINSELATGTDYPDSFDKIILYDNINPLNLYNGDTVIFSQFLQAINGFNRRSSNSNSKNKAFICLKWQNKMPRKDSPNETERLFFQQYVAFQHALKKAHTERIKNLPTVMRSSNLAKDQVEEWIKEVEQIVRENPNLDECFLQIIERFQEINVDMAQHIMKESAPLPRLYMVGAGFGYAITTHKAQGSEYPKVCYVLERFDKPLIYTGLSRAKEQLMVIDLSKG